MNYFCIMLNTEEEKFMKYWDENREERSKFSNKLSSGLPMAILFGLPILLLIAAVYLFFPEWYTKVSSSLQGTLPVIIIAVSIAVVFYAFTRMHFKWEMNEQLYKELLQKDRKSNAAKNESQL